MKKHSLQLEHFQAVDYTALLSLVQEMTVAENRKNGVVVAKSAITRLSPRKWQSGSTTDKWNKKAFWQQKIAEIVRRIVICHNFF